MGKYPPKAGDGAGRADRAAQYLPRAGDGAVSMVENPKRAKELLAAEPAGWMQTLGARITEAEPGRVVI